MRRSDFVRVLIGCGALALGAVRASAQVQFDTDTNNQGFADEDHDWSITPPTKAKDPPYHAPTPTTLPGGRVIRTSALKTLLDGNSQVVVIDVLNSASGVRDTIPGAVWMPGAGSGKFYRAEQARYEEVLLELTGGDRAKPLVFLCLGSECWLSYNAALRALDAGFTDVIWYRGGSDAWHGASLPMARARKINW